MLPTYRDGEHEVTFLDLCRSLRAFSTDAERCLWAHLRNRQLAHAKFRRQHQFGPYILDFYCHQQRLVIEADGGQHAEEAIVAYDGERTRYLEERGLRVLRFTNHEVLRQTEAVLGRIFEVLTGADPPAPSPPGSG